MQETQETEVQSLGQKDSSEEANSTPLQYSYLENSKGRGVWWATVHGAAKDRA